MITNGDGFRVSAESQLHEISVSPSDYIRYAYVRQSETTTALKRLGLNAEHITFLGYPDRGLMPMWLSHWSPENTFRSGYTLSNRSPYKNSPTRDAPYCGQSLLDDIKRQMQLERPTDIFVTHPNDDHPDHAAASVFVLTALEQLKADGAVWARTARLHYYLVHHGDWPVPQGLHEDNILIPPAVLASRDTHWEKLPLTRSDTQAKYAAIKRYRSQTEIVGRFLYSFARKNELFGTLGDSYLANTPELPEPGSHTGQQGGHWIGLKPVGSSATDNSVLRAIHPGANISNLYVCRNANSLCVRLITQSKPSTDVSYTITLRPIINEELASQSRVSTGENTQPNMSLITVSPQTGTTTGSAQVRYTVQGNEVAFSVPMASLGLDRNLPGSMLYIKAETYVGRVLLDSTGFRGLTLRQSPLGSGTRMAPGKRSLAYEMVTPVGGFGTAGTRPATYATNSSLHP